jgi:hypothetical protein
LNEGWVSDLPFGDPRFTIPSFQTYQIVGASSTTLGYSFNDPGASGGHFVQVFGSPDPEQVKARMLNFACHFLVDLTPVDGLQELLEKTSEIRDYYCSLANWQVPAAADPIPVSVNPLVARYERASFSYPEE